jgi:hemoglobin
MRETLAMTRPSLYEFAGGDPAFLALASAFHDRCLEDPDLNHVFSHHVSPGHVENLAAYWAEVLGGPPTYSRNHGGHSAMLEIHARQGGESLEPNFVNCFVRAIDDAQLPDDPDFRASMRRYIEWATKDVVSYLAEESVVPPNLAVPRWSWDGPA